MPDNFGLFKIKEIKKLNNPPSKFDRTASAYLCKKLLAKRQIEKAPNLQKWSIEFQRLRAFDEMEKARIKRALKWYCNHIRKPYVPVILSARSFRAKFIHLEIAMERNCLSTTVDMSEDYLTADAYDIQEANGYLVWPDKNKEDCPALDRVELAVIQASLDSYRDYDDALYAMSKNKSLPQTYRGIAQCIGEKGGDPKAFVQYWMLDIHRMAWTWDKWSGNLDKFAFNYNARRYQSQVEEIIAYYCGMPELWITIKELLNSEDQTKKGRGR